MKERGGKMTMKSGRGSNLQSGKWPATLKLTELLSHSATQWSSLSISDWFDFAFLYLELFHCFLCCTTLIISRRKFTSACYYEEEKNPVIVCFHCLGGEGEQCTPLPPPPYRWGGTVYPHCFVPLYRCTVVEIILSNQSLKDISTTLSRYLIAEMPPNLSEEIFRFFF